ncbi:MAG: hypothetical protein HFH82_01875 [Lachnospiraceae bacterium]|nr:hypothetical protein [Lachnospiraceae bacterium]
MYSYSLVQWLFFFYLYCFMGWCVESVWVSVRKRHLTNRGFLRGPFLPIYGSGAMMMLVASMPFRDSIVLTYLSGCVGATLLEYVTGVVMEKLFKVRYWDYSRKKFNFQGHICLTTTISWGFLTILMTEILHVPVEKFVFSIPGTALNILTFILTVGIVVDFTLSFKAAVDLRELLIKMEQAKEELLHIQKRLEAIIAAANHGMENYKEAFVESVNNIRAVRMEDVVTGIESRLDSLKQAAQSKSSAYLESVKEEIFELKTKYVINLEVRRYLGGLKDIIQRNLIRDNPNMTSERFQEDLDELKQKASEKKPK